MLGAMLIPIAASAAVAWPAQTTRLVDIAIVSEGNYEPSGLAWDREDNALFTVSDDGKITRMNMDGTGQVMRAPRKSDVGTDLKR